jgi:hypothetical protein
MSFLVKRTFALFLLLSFAVFSLASISVLAEDTSLQWTFSSGPQKTQLIELYTSEGCSSCPPAERWLSKLKTDPDLWTRYIPVAFHVDYWDHLGWKDPFANSLNTQRQRHYRQQGSSGSVYTPQFIVNGEEWRGYFLRPLVGSLPEPDVNPSGRLMIKAFEENRQLIIETLFKSQKPLQPIRQQSLHVALIAADIQTAVKRGENAGRTLKHNFVVLRHKSYSMTGTPKTLTAKGHFNLQEDLPIELTSDALIGVAAWISNESDKIVQATGGWIDVKVSEAM